MFDVSPKLKCFEWFRQGDYKMDGNSLLICCSIDGEGTVFLSPQSVHGGVVFLFSHTIIYLACTESDMNVEMF